MWPMCTFTSVTIGAYRLCITLLLCNATWKCSSLQHARCSYLISRSGMWQLMYDFTLEDSQACCKSLGNNYYWHWHFMGQLLKKTGAEVTHEYLESNALLEYQYMYVCWLEHQIHINLVHKISGTHLNEMCPAHVLPWMTQHNSRECYPGVVHWVELSDCWHWCQWMSQCLVDTHMLDQSHTEQYK